MKKYTFSELLQYENTLKELFIEHGIRFNSTNRFARYFKYLKEIEKIRTQDIQSFTMIVEKDKAKYYYSQYYVLDTYNLINSLRKRPQDKVILKKKLLNITKGSYLLSEEDASDTLARDTSFELNLFSFLVSNKFDVKICEPNPDLRILGNKCTYDIECKRPQSMKSLKKNLKKAVRQLDKYSKPIDVIPTIAISLDQILFARQDVILSADNEETALKFLKKTLMTFSEENAQTITRLIRENSCLVLYYLSCLAGFKNEAPMANATYIVGNMYNFENTIKNSVYKDFMSLIQN